MRLRVSWLEPIEYGQGLSPLLPHPPELIWYWSTGADNKVLHMVALVEGTKINDAHSIVRRSGWKPVRFISVDAMPYNWNPDPKVFPLPELQ